MLNRWLEQDALLTALEEVGAGCIGFMPLSQGLLTDRYLAGIPEGSRASRDSTLPSGLLTEELRTEFRALDDMARRRHQSLAQMALAWTLVTLASTSTLVGASSVEQLEANVAALDNLDFTDDELSEIDQLTGVR